MCLGKVEMNLCTVSCTAEVVEGTYYCKWHTPANVKKRENDEFEKEKQKEKEMRMEDKMLEMFELLKEGLIHEKKPLNEWKDDVGDIIDYIEGNESEF